MSADSVPSSKTNIFSKQAHLLSPFRTYSRCAMFDWSDTVFRRRNVTHRRISNTILQPRYWRREADSLEVCRLGDCEDIIQIEETLHLFLWPDHYFSPFPVMFYLPCADHVLLFVDDVVTSWPQTKISDWSEIKCIVILAVQNRTCSIPKCVSCNF
jgi:hypothetical protein